MPFNRLNSEAKNFDRTFLSSLNFDESSSEIHRLTQIYHRLCDKNHQLTAEYFRDFLSTIFDLNDETIVERLLIVIGQGGKSFSLQQFLFAINFFLYASPDEQMKLLFRIYDVSGDGNLQREELFTFLRKDLTIVNEKDDSDVILHELITLIFKKFDHDHDGVISYDDYHRTCAENPTLIQCFGQVLPRLLRKHVVKSMFNGNVPKKRDIL